MPTYKFETVASFSQSIRATAHVNRNAAERLEEAYPATFQRLHHYNQAIGAAAALETLAAIVEQSNLTVKP